MRLPPGFRFHPTDVELILYYLKRKIMGKKLHYEAIAEVNIYKFSPWDLPDKSSLKSKDLEWFFFCPREKKYATGVRVKRATENGYWKTTGKDRIISCNEKTVGSVKTLIFHLGHAPHGERTDWVIHEYRICDDQLAEAGVQGSYVLCKVFKKNGLGPKNGAQYGAPFNEDDWADDDDDNDVAQNHAISLAAEDQPQTVSMQPEEQSLPLGSGLFDFGSVNGQLPIHDEGLSSSVVAPASMMAADEANDEIIQLLNSFADEDMLSPVENELKQDDLTDNGNKNFSSNEGLEIYNGLHDLDSWTMINEGGFDFSGVQFDYPSNILPEDNSTYIELDDLRLPLDCSTEVTTVTPFSSLCEASASYGHENMLQLPSGTRLAGMDQYTTSGNRLAGMDQYTKFANELAMLPITSESDRSLNVLQMMDHHFYQGAIASNNIDTQFGQLENAVFFAPHTMERGSHLVNLYSRFTESIPAHLPSAAKLLALSPYGGSSIHIKAEVTHGAGECTNEALEVMMGGSSSCWCNLLFWKFQLTDFEGLLNLVEFISNLILVCCINYAISWTSCYPCLNENLSYSYQQPKLIISLNTHLLLFQRCSSMH